MNRLTADLRLALRSLLRRPGFLVVAVFTLALGIGSVSAIFSVVHGTLLTPLPYADAERIIRVHRTQGAWSGPIAEPVLEDWRAATRDQFAALAAFTESTVNLTGDGDAESLAAFRVTPEFWTVMAFAPQLGRYFSAEEDRARERVVVIAHELWQRRFGGARDVVGRDLQLDGESYRIVGVAPDGFRYPGNAQAYLPTNLADSNAGRGNNYLHVLGRLAEGATLAQAEAALKAINTQLAAQYPDNHEGLGARLTPLQDLLNRDVQQPLLVLLGAAALVLLIACANLANLLLARGSTRQRELAVRAALGAGRSALMRAVIAEALVIAVLGALFGLVIAALAVPALLAMAPDLLPRHARPGIDLTVVLVSLLVGGTTVMAFAAIPALRAARTAPAGALQEEGRGGTGSRRRARARSALVAFEVALSLTLLVGAGLLIESLRQLGKVDTGVETEGVLTAAVVLPGTNQLPGEDLMAWYLRQTTALQKDMVPLLQRLAAIPGVRSVGISDSLPLSGVNNTSSDVTVIGREFAAGQPQPGANWRFANPALLETVGMRIVRGRNLEDSDGRPGDTFRNVLVNETFVRRFLADVDPLTQRIAFFDDEPKQIVGVVNDTRLYGVDREPVPEVYIPVANAHLRQYQLALKVVGEPMGYAEQLRHAVREVNPELPLLAVRTMEQMAASGGAMRRFNMTLMSVFSGVALVLAAVGLYGVIAYSVAERRQEFGIRMSLGARAGDVMRMVMGQGARLVAAGLVLGIVGALLLGHVLASQLYGIGSADPKVLASVMLCLGTVGLGACLVPALRAARVPPMVALRNA